jgi:predicted  nucleic acid-binding Zn-ribbon protein
LEDGTKGGHLVNDLEIDLATQLAAALAEAERLRAELRDAETLIEDLRDGVKLIEEYRAEVERLRAYTKYAEQFGEELGKARTEVERLRHVEQVLEAQYVEKEAEVERLRGLGRAWTEAEDRWFEVSDARPYEAEAAARAALARRAAADALRNALTGEVTPIQTDP